LTLAVDPVTAVIMTMSLLLLLL